MLALCYGTPNATKVLNLKNVLRDVLGIVLENVLRNVLGINPRTVWGQLLALITNYVSKQMASRPGSTSGSTEPSAPQRTSDVQENYSCSSLAELTVILIVTVVSYPDLPTHSQSSLVPD